MISLDRAGEPVFDLPDSWVWDFWFADDGDRYHLFFLYASRALHDPERRHHRASIGHAVSHDLVRWERVADALVRSDAPAFDDLATWTGSVVRRPDGGWILFYTGASLDAAGRPVQRMGAATSDDMEAWTKAPGPLFEPDPEWYVGPDDDTWHDPAFRDPFVCADPSGDGWHMLFTARAPHGPLRGRGIIGHAVSKDLRSWTLAPPLSEPSESGFGQLEVPHTITIDGRSALLFCCNPPHASAARRAEGGGTWAAPSASEVAGFDIDRAHPLTAQGLYAARALRRRDDGQWVLFAFRDAAEGRPFLGGIVGPYPLRWEGDRLVAG